MKISFSETKLNENTFTPYMEITFKDNLCLDPNMFVEFRRLGVSIEDFMLAEYKQALEQNLKNELRKRFYEKDHARCGLLHMRPKPQPPKDKREHLFAQSAGQLRTILEKLPSDAEVYISAEFAGGNLMVCRGNETIAEITLTGF